MNQSGSSGQLQKKFQNPGSQNQDSGVIVKKFLILILLCSMHPLLAQSRANDIPVDQLPAEVRQVLDRYIEILTTSPSINEAATKFVEIAGGSLVNEDGSLRSTVAQFGLKKDFNDIKFYEVPAVITRVNKTTTNGDGYGATRIRGTVYKIWIRKKNEKDGMPAPVTIVVPEGHPTITTPKVTNVGSY